MPRALPTKTELEQRIVALEHLAHSNDPVLAEVARLEQDELLDQWLRIPKPRRAWLIPGYARRPDAQTLALLESLR